MGTEYNDPSPSRRDPSPVRGRRQLMKEQLAKAKEAVGWATGDRHVEAEGRAEAVATESATSTNDATEEVVDEKEHEVRKEHGDIRPERA
jgi:uncharacterized protein YjbJ (UPF0337 family)